MSTVHAVPVARRDGIDGVEHEALYEVRRARDELGPDRALDQREHLRIRVDQDGDARRDLDPTSAEYKESFRASLVVFANGCFSNFRNAAVVYGTLGKREVSEWSFVAPQPPAFLFPAYAYGGWTLKIRLFHNSYLPTSSRILAYIHSALRKAISGARSTCPFHPSSGVGLYAKEDRHDRLTLVWMIIPKPDLATDWYVPTDVFHRQPCVRLAGRCHSVLI
ncbi:hypothetical protein BC827DRAFT_1266839 [Russula dissimulans]|nr:hypothetical protein BC827DRAFT_1266839 [Russula dissimulans]